jgi:CubicO group peptidase (beta-lactamase class C family)
MAAELEEMPPGSARLRFTGGCLYAILTRAALVRVRAWLAQPTWLLVAFSLGILIAVLDRTSATRATMWLALLLGSLGMGWCRPGAAWRWGVLLATGIPFLAAAAPSGGPYAFDRADAFYGVPFSVLFSSLAALCRRRSGLAVSGILAAAMLPGWADTLDAQAARPRELTAADLSDFAEAVFAAYLAHSPEPSLAFVVVKDDSILFARGYGSEDPAGSRSVDPEHTVFWLASLSKLVTTDAVMREYERGRLLLDAAASRYLGWELPSHRGWPRITVRDLLTHTAGLDAPFMLGTVDEPSRLTPLIDHLQALRWRAGSRPGEVLRYSNYGMALAGAIVERVSGTPFAQYVEGEIFGPLRMTRSSFRQPMPPELVRRLASAGTGDQVDYLLAAPAGAMVGTAADMSRFLISQLQTAGPREHSLQLMHTTGWRLHPQVPGVGLGWFETTLGGVNALYHTGARHHFSVAWIEPTRRLGVFLVHSMRQGGPFQDLRTTVIRGFVERYLEPDPVPASTPPALTEEGIFRPQILSTTTVERAGYMFLDTPLHRAAGGTMTLQAPGGLGTITAAPSGGGLFIVRDGAQAGMRLGFVERNGSVRLALGGTLLDPITLLRLSWWERGLVHATALALGAGSLAVGAVVHGVRVVRRRTRGVSAMGRAPWTVIMGAGLALILALVAFPVVVATTPEAGAAEHMRAGLRVVLALLSTTAVLGLALPVVTIVAWRGAGAGRLNRVMLILLSLCGLAVSAILWHYRLVGVQL